MGWANRITLARALLTLVLWALIVYGIRNPAEWVWLTSCAIFVFAAATDIVDGALARHFGEVSVFGRIADPLVDKLLVLGTMVVLLGITGMEAILPPWAVAVMMARELMVTAIRGAIEGKGVSFQAMPLGKAKMILQSLALGGVLLHFAGFGLIREYNLAYLTVMLATLLTVISGVDYALRAWKILREA